MPRRRAATIEHVLAAFLRRNAPAHVYELGDLDDFDWPFTRWFGWERARGARAGRAALHAAASAGADRDRRGAGGEGWGADCARYSDAAPGSTFTSRRRCSRSSASATRSSTSEPHLKLALDAARCTPRRRARGRAARRGRPARSWTRSTEEAYPETWFTPRMLATRRYVGIRREGRLACVAGVHVYSPDMGRRGARERRDVAGAAGARASRRVRAPRSAYCCSRTGSRRSP